MNIAGISAWGTVEHLTHQHWKSMIDVNLMGPIHVIETFVPPMVAAGRGGHLVNVSSAAGLVALPWHAAYSASKYGLRGLSRGAAVRPGPAPHRGVGGGARRGENASGADRPDRRRGPRASAGAAHGSDRFSGHAVSPEKVADKILAGVRRNRFLIYTSPTSARCTRSSGWRGGPTAWRCARSTCCSPARCGPAGRNHCHRPDTPLDCGPPAAELPILDA